MNAPKLYHFEPWEWNRGGEEWIHVLDTRHQVLIDATRRMWGHPIHVSPDSGAVGRRDGSDNRRWHNIDVHGLVYACDYLPANCRTRKEALSFLHLVDALGWTGIGLYVGWPSGTRVHLDTRTDRKPGEPAIWGAILRRGHRHDVRLDEALEALLV